MNVSLENFACVRTRSFIEGDGEQEFVDVLRCAQKISRTGEGGNGNFMFQKRRHRSIVSGGEKIIQNISFSLLSRSSEGSPYLFLLYSSMIVLLLQVRSSIIEL